MGEFRIFMNSFARTSMLYGSDAMDVFRKSTIAVSGLGGVGSAAVELLARSGIGTIILNDFDVINESDINRQLTALTVTIGKKKTTSLASRLKLINPDINVIINDAFCDESNREDIFRDTNFIVDAVDSLGPKVGLIEFAYLNNYNIISCMGAGNRVDPSKVALDDISAANGCPLLKRVKKYLRKRSIVEGIPVVYSSELPLIPKEIPIKKCFRGRNRGTIGSVSYLPIVFAGWATYYVLKKLATPNNTQ